MGWREAIDGLRPSVQSLWRDASLAERQRFLRHLRPWWDIHRHRIAPEVATAVDRLVAEGRLSFLAGRIDRRGLLMHGDADELVPEPAVRKLVDKLNTQKGVTVDYRVCQGADHVFANHAEQVSDAVEGYVGKIVARKTMALAAD